MTSSTFPRVLVANRGEIAVRIMRTLRRMGISPVAVYSDADRHEPHVSLADRAVHLGAAPARDSYLRIDRIIDAALATGARAVHPGYGFLSEQPALARACAAAGLVFIGPSAEAIEAMGDKIVAKRTVQAAGVPVLPGRLERGMDDAALTAAAHEIGFPVLVKPSAGGGGKGMVVVRSADGLADAIAAARRAASCRPCVRPVIRLGFPQPRRLRPCPTVDDAQSTFPPKRCRKNLRRRSQRCGGSSQPLIY